MPRAVWEVIKRLSGDAYKWAVKNVKRVWNWIQNGATFEWISNEIDKIIGRK